MKLISLIKKPLRPIYRHHKDAKAIRNFKAERKIKRNSEKIRVGFLAQYLPAWNKFKPIYDKLSQDSRFEVFLICVPIEIHDGKLDDPNLTENSTYNYFLQEGYQAVNALIGKNKWLDLKSLALDYIFYPRPYNTMMPQDYHTQRVSRYTKISCVLYGMAMTEEIFSVAFSRDFFRNVYCYFAESETAMREHMRSFSFAHRKNYQKTVYYGMPVLEHILNNKSENSTIWNFADGKFKILWTPRWTTDKKLGGSNFFHYKDYLIDRARKNNNSAYIFRPHPLMLSNFISTGELSPQQAEEFCEICKREPNIELDESEDYVSTMWGSDVLVTDISGVLPEYFVTGKPVIYCATNMVLTPAAHTKKIFEGCYIVDNEKELEEYLSMLESGNDPLKEKRKEIIAALWGTEITRCTDRFVEELAKRN